ncbi:hypothetical protein GGS23DRAFT_363408 [Durotheca rogersii]|uniref:uncharacterized protein n=1 Tax=Durotheca rogersii TaxID=419775 RepID=UPI002220E6CA|nr:uncharacterized protein GGS23DRAFT_363408 [Durotheca rogersii]KAI5865986.1 hypothetical protein GGS23DRAFT_363408 [Durotheca rogersii]
MATMATSARAPVTVEHATPSDISDLITVWWDAFSDDFIQRVYPQTPDGRAWLERAFARNMAPEDPEPGELVTKCLIVRDPADGLPAAIAVYHVVPEGSDAAQRSWRARWPTFEDLPDVKGREDVLDSFFGPMEKTQTYLLEGRGHVFLEALGTREAHRKKGYGGALVRWGADLADRLGVECGRGSRTAN